MVLFCGAGISVPAGFPTFGGLVDQIYASLNVDPIAREKELIKQKKFDEALGLLEDRVVEGKMRAEVAKLFSRAPKPESLALHQALLEVSQHDSAIRIVTTNYDDNFARATRKGIRFRAGKDTPDLQTWNSVFHLHGRVPATGAGASELVLTERQTSVRPTFTVSGPRDSSRG